MSSLVLMQAAKSPGALLLLATSMRTYMHPACPTGTLRTDPHLDLMLDHATPCASVPKQLHVNDRLQFPGAMLPVRRSVASKRHANDELCMGLGALYSDPIFHAHSCGYSSSVHIKPSMSQMLLDCLEALTGAN